MSERCRILIVEDEEELLLGLQDRLESEGYEVLAARDGEEALARASQGTLHCIVLDVTLPKKNGFDVCRDLRARDDHTPILMLTARTEVSDRVHGLRLGADDYLVKPFATMELVARIEALIRRIPQTPLTIEQYRGSEIDLDFRSGRVVVRGRPVELSNMEMRLLRYLVEHRGKVLTREQLLESVWGHATTLLTRTVDVHIAMLRQKLEENPSRPELIVTVHRAGYKFGG
jgi:DNA-binding response OmpR family regulator